MTPSLATGAAATVDAVFGDAETAAVARHLAFSPAASMQELAEAAGISRATLFRRFSSRAVLVAELSAAAAEAFVAAVARADPDDGPPPRALDRVVEAVAPLTVAVGLLSLQPLQQHVEATLLDRIADTEDTLRRLVRRGQEGGHFRVDVDPDWVLAMLTWLGVGAADAVRLGRLTPAAAQRHLALTLALTVTRTA